MNLELLTLVSNAAHADWKKYGGKAQSNAYYDPTSVVVDGHIVKVSPNGAIQQVECLFSVIHQIDNAIVDTSQRGGNLILNIAPVSFSPLLASIVAPWR